MLELAGRNEPPNGLGFGALEGVDPSPNPPRDPKLSAFVVSGTSSSISSSSDKLTHNLSSFSAVVLASALVDGISGCDDDTA